MPVHREDSHRATSARRRGGFVSQTRTKGKGQKATICAMKFVLASWGSRGEVEPCAAVGRELLRRGHQVRIAVPPDLVGFAELAGLKVAAFGPELQAFWTRTETSGHTSSTSLGSSGI